MRKIETLCLLLGIGCLGAAGAVRPPTIEPLSSATMKHLVGGGCDQACQNACQPMMGCSTSNCSAQQGQGSLCQGGGGGVGTAWRCVGVNSSGLKFCTPPSGSTATCQPERICECTGGTPNRCMASNNPASQSGLSNPCSDGACGE